MPRLFKCKGMAGLYAPRALGLMAANRGQINGAHSASDYCDCEPSVPLKRKKALTKKSASQYSFTYFVQVFLLAQWLGVLRKRLIIIVYVGALWAAFGHIAQLLLVQGPLLILFPSFSCLLSRLIYNIQNIWIIIYNGVSSKDAWKKLFEKAFSLLRQLQCGSLEVWRLKFDILGENQEKVFYTFKLPPKNWTSKHLL